VLLYGHMEISFRGDRMVDVRHTARTRRWITAR
jgi:hypothetical protein